ncbi:diguanylate cyclase [Elioraea sp.]|uniref:diguanylate cyclase n=1 Tax=Elioraea sp. TaxID=2185103 RepID=UPI00307F359D
MLLLIGLSAATARPAEQTLAVEAADDPGGLCHPARPWAAPLAFTPVSSPAVHRCQVAGPLWLRTTLVNPTPQPVRRVVTVWFPYLDEVMLIAADRSGRIDAARHGASIPRPADALPSAVPAFAVTLPAQDSMEILICIRSSAIIIAPLLVLGETAFWRAAMTDAAKVAIMLGVIAAAFVYALTCAVTLRQPAFPAFMAFAGMSLLYVALATGYAKLWFWPGLGWDTMRLYGIAQAGLLATGVLFLRVLLRPARISPFVDRIMVTLIATAAATAPAMILPAPLRVAAHALAAGIGPLVVLVAMLHLWRQGVRHAGTAAIGWGPGLLGAVYLYLRVHDVTPYHPWNHLLGPAAVTFGCACFAWVLAQSIRSVEERTLIDPLTGLWNRRWLAAEGEAAMARCRRSGGLLSVAVFDADYFKQINDRWGHGVGDVVLKHLAARATETLRPADRVARIGGEEFCILLPDLTAEQAAAAVERVRATIEASGIGPLPAGAVTISGGVAMNRGGTVPFDALLHAADTALYRAKEAGRNRVAIAPQVTPAEDAQSRRPSDGALQPLFAGPD